MKKTIISLFVLMLVLSFAFGANSDATQKPEDKINTVDTADNKPAEPGAQPMLAQEGQGTGQGEGTQNENMVQNKGEDSSLMEQEQLRNQAQNQKLDDIKKQLETKKQEMSKASENAKGNIAESIKNQNEVRLAVHALLSMEELTGGIGKDISQIARDFNNSENVMTQAEEKIQTRSGFSRFFMGGDKKAAAEIEAEASKNQEKLQELTRLKDECDCSDEVKSMMEEQIKTMEQEQTRLMEKASSEKKSNGLFGWMFK